MNRFLRINYWRNHLLNLIWYQITFSFWSLSLFRSILSFAQHWGDVLWLPGPIYRSLFLLIVQWFFLHCWPRSSWPLFWLTVSILPNPTIGPEDCTAIHTQQSQRSRNLSSTTTVWTPMLQFHHHLFESQLCEWHSLSHFVCSLHR